jgi:sterol desaturase/sphingolipid hydroxylase (fatty acid hydroxylase superfamily)
MDRSEFLKASPPMFKSGLLDKFTRVHHVVPVVIFGPAIAVLFAFGVDRVGLWQAFAYAIGGYFFWTLAEYWIHRVIFHFEPEEGIGARLHWMIHGVHHDHPNDPLRLVMPPAVSSSLYFIFLGIFWVTLGPRYTWGFHAGFVVGYMFYDLTHYYLHHYSPKTDYGRRLKKNHMLHHFKDHGMRYGVSNLVWDKVFGTVPK